MTEPNIYSPPEADLEVAEATEKILANRWTRFWAALIDGILLGILFLPFILLYQTSFGEQLISSLSSIAVEIISSLAGVIIYLILNGYFLSTSGQTIGKMILKIQIVDYHTEELLSFNKVFSVRYLPFYIVSQLPALGILGLIDCLFIFSKENRCLHDLLAGTKVIYAPNHRLADTALPDSTVRKPIQ